MSSLQQETNIYTVRGVLMEADAEPNFFGLMPDKEHQGLRGGRGGQVDDEVRSGSRGEGGGGGGWMRLTRSPFHHKGSRRTCRQPGLRTKHQRRGEPGDGSAEAACQG